MELIDGYDHLCVSFVHSCVLFLVVMLDSYIFIFGGIGLVYMGSLVVDWVRLWFSESILAYVYVCRFSALVCSALFCAFLWLL